MGVLCITYKKQIAQNTDEELFGSYEVTDRKGTWGNLFYGKIGFIGLRNICVTVFAV